MTGGEIVESGTVEVDYVIREWVDDDGSKVYDWIAARDSDEFYDSLEEARREAIRSLEY